MRRTLYTRDEVPHVGFRRRCACKAVKNLIMTIGSIRGYDMIPYQIYSHRLVACANFLWVWRTCVVINRTPLLVLVLLLATYISNVEFRA